MPKFRATVRFLDLMGSDVLDVRKALDERLQTTDIGQWRVVDIAPQGSQPRPTAVARSHVDGALAAKLLLTGAIFWGVWFFSFLLE